MTVLSDKPPYPREILPEPGFNLMDVAKLPEDFVLARRTDKPIGEYIKSIWKELAGFSVNLMGGKFEQHHLAFSPKTHNVDWYPDNCPQPDSYCRLIEYDISDPQGLYFQATVFSERFPIDKELDGRFETEFFELEVVHKPTLANFWHFQYAFIQIMVDGQNETHHEIERDSFQKKKRFKRHFAKWIEDKFYLGLFISNPDGIPIPPIPQQSYSKT